MAALGAANAPGAAAQGGAEPSGSWQIEEMTITARRREENLQEVPVSVTAFSAKDIAEIGVTDVSHLSEMTPNLMIMPNTGGDDGTLICMRGLCRTDFTITEDPMVGIYLDGVYIGKSIGSLFDMVISGAGGSAARPAGHALRQEHGWWCRAAEHAQTHR